MNKPGLSKQPNQRNYLVLDAVTYDKQEGAFVLFPERDSAARVALSAYAEATHNIGLARYLRLWLKSIHDRRKVGK